MENDIKDKIASLGSDTIMGSMEALNDDTRDRIDKLQEAVAESKEAEESNEENIRKGVISGQMNEAALAAMAKQGYFRKTRPIVRDNKKVGRNDTCPCGSGKKYKDCCLNSGRFETTHYE